MANIISGQGATLIIDSSSTGAGSWYQTSPGMTNMSFQVSHYGTSTASVTGSTVVIEVSNDGVNACATVLGTIVITSASMSSPAAEGFATASNWRYYRAKINSVSAASAAATGTTMAIKVFASGQAIG
tara:strand:+ start:100 stop:483 length:384 start_codon:yes stop_codon:yes gene_type:complete